MLRKLNTLKNSIQNYKDSIVLGVLKCKFSKELEKSIPEDRRVWIETMLRKEEKKIVQVKARLLKLFTNNEKWHKEFMPWNLFLLRSKKKEDEENYQKMKCKWANLCEQLLQKIKKTKN